MKAISVRLLLLFLSSSVYASQLDWVDEQIEAIKPPRKGVEIAKMENPFIFLAKNKSQKEESKSGVSSQDTTSLKAHKIADSNTSNIQNKVFVLSAIINASALIDGVWYKKNDNIENYTVVDITKTTAILKTSDKMVVLSTSTKTPTIKFKNK